MQSRGAINKKDFLIPFNPKIFDLGYQKSEKTKGVYWKRRPEGGACLTLRNVGYSPRSEQVKQGPLFFFKPNGKETWQTRRARNEEKKLLEDKKIKCRFWDSWIQETTLEEGDGYCRFCNKDFQDEGWCCSPECEILYKNQFDRGICAVCFAPFTYSSNERTIRHHVQYYPEEIVEVHENCHKEIHSGSEEYAYLLPPQDEVNQFYEKGEYEPTSEDLARKKSEKDKRKQLKLLKKQRKAPSTSRIPRHNRDFYF